MPAILLDQLDTPIPWAHRLRFRLLREWCFIRAVAWHIRWRLPIMAVILLGGGLLFQTFEPTKELSVFEATYYTWSLVFGEPPEAFPPSTVLRILFFLVPVLGLTVIVEGILDFALLLRDRRRCERDWCVTMAASLSNHVVLAGLGKLGYRAFLLLRRLGESVVVIERNPQNRFLEEVRRDGSPLLIGDGRDDALLAQANVAKARSIILATDDDLVNLEMALDARRLHPDIRVVLRVFDQNMADKIRSGFGLPIAISQSAISAPAFAMAAVDASIVNSFVVGGRLVIVQRWTVRDGGPFCGKTVGRVMTDASCCVTELRRGAQRPTLFPPPETELHSGDELLIEGPFDILSKLPSPASAGRQSEPTTD